MPPRPTKKPLNVLVVCHGNVNRSPLAGAVLASKLGQGRVRTRCLRDKDGYLATKKVREFAAEAGYDLSNHRALRLEQVDVDWADRVVYMDTGNRRRLEQFNGAVGKSLCLAGYLPEGRWPRGWSQLRVPDPAYVPPGEYLRELLTGIVEASERLAKWWLG